MEKLVLVNKNNRISDDFLNNVKLTQVKDVND